MNVKQQNSLSGRQIMHVDMDSFFASVAQNDDPVLQGRPIVVSGKPGTRTVVAAASKEAKRFGIKSGMPTWQARRLCPRVLLVPGKPVRYQQVHNQVFKILYQYTPDIEVFSIDEWFLDVTATAARFGGTEAIAGKIKAEMREMLGDVITCSIGIGPNKMLAKLGSDSCKPNGLHVVSNLSFLSNLPLQALCGIGPRTKKRLLDLGIFDLKGLRRCSREFLRRHFGVCGDQLYLWARGQDNSHVVPFNKKHEEKSFGASYTLPRDTLDLAYLKSVLLTLSEKVAVRLRKKGFYGRTVHVWVRNSDFEHWSKQKTGLVDTNDGYQIYQKAWQIFEELRFRGWVRALGVSVLGLGREEQLTLWHPLLQPDLGRARCRPHSFRVVTTSLPLAASLSASTRLLPSVVLPKKWSCYRDAQSGCGVIRAIDHINTHYGKNTIFRASQLLASLAPQTGLFVRSRFK